MTATGSNGWGQLNVFNWHSIKAIAAGHYHTVGLREDGTVVVTGFDYYGQGDVAGWNNIRAIAAGYYHTVGLKEDGTVVAVGANDYGQLEVAHWRGIKAIAAGRYFTVGLKENGTIIVTKTSKEGPWDKLDVAGWNNIKAISVGLYHIVGLKEDGTVVATGGDEMNNDWYGGWLNVSDWSNTKAVAAGYLHTVGLKEDGSVVAAGYNFYGVVNISDWMDIRLPDCAVQSSSIAEIISAIEGMLGDGKISDVGLANALISRLYNAQHNLESSPISAKNMIEAAINTIVVQAGKKIDMIVAERLLEDLNDIINSF